jgi:NAD(P)-dependent dehydrogenase (short-subunit alcohol dehydrogenase family)
LEAITISNPLAYLNANELTLTINEKNMKQKVCMITGANSGIGKAAAIKIAQQGHLTIMACRNLKKGKAAMSKVKEVSGSDAVELMVVDMSLQSSIRDLCDAFLSKYKHLDVLIHNAAIFDITQKIATYTAEGIESVWATNHLGPVLLTELLWDALANSAHGRVITIASKGLMAKPFLKVDLEDPEFKKKPFSIENAYYQSKLAQIMYTYWLAEQSRENHFTANCIRVPAVSVDIAKFSGLPTILKKVYALKSKFSLSPEEMASGYAYLATAVELNNVTGIYFDEKMKSVKPGKYAQQVQEIENVMNLTMSYLRKSSG